MEPIIDPIWFYLADVCRSLSVVSTVFFFTLLAMIMGQYVHNQKFHKGMLIAIVIVGVVNCIIPSHNTVMKMIAASIVTPNNIKAMEGDMIEFVIKIAEAVANARGDK